ncbi:MAG: hypothetical protein AAF289_06460 [Cyanobacteria bacterium P01_A01_bin.135]
MIVATNRPIFHLKLAQVLQGEFDIKALNLLVVFQVNCPGCFLYALPLAARLHDQHGDRVNVLGLSTAFEDFDLNTAENTRRLLESGEVVGMTKQYWQRQGESRYGVPIRFPVAFDRREDHRGGYTFRANQLRGTPSWILFDERSMILAQWFGHKPESEVEAILHQSLPS